MYIEVQLEIEVSNQESAHLTVIEMTGKERVGAPYRFELTAIQPAYQTSYGELELVSASATVRVVEKQQDGSGEVVRTIRGVVYSVEEGMEASGDGSYYFQIVIEPRLSDLGRFVSQDLFAGLTYPEVVRHKLVAAQFNEKSDFELRLTDPSAYGEKPWKDGDPDSALAQDRLCIQYRESDLAFISRLAEHAGISFYFLDEGDHEMLVFTDHDAGFASLPTPIQYRGGEGHGLLTLKRRVQAIASDFYAYDYSYRTPNATYTVNGEQLFDVLGGESHLDVPSPGAHVEYAPNAKTSAEAARIAKLRADAEEGTREWFSAQTGNGRLYPGVRFCVDNHTRLTSQDELLIVAADTFFKGNASFLASSGAHGGEGRDGPSASGGHSPQFTVMLTLVRTKKHDARGRAIPFRPERTTPRPRIHGVVTGVVQGPSGANENHQHLDAQGRYLVRLHLDQSTRHMPRIRMAQPHAGENYGHHFPLRPGCEVLVAFVDGDPDRPVIVGAVPNPVKRSPVVAPKDGEDVELSRIRTRSGILIEFSDGTKS